MKSNIISIQNHHMSSGAILHQHRTRREDGSRWHMMLSLFIFISAFSLPLVSLSFIPAYADTTTLTVDNSNTVLELTLPSNLTLDLTPSSTNNYVSFGTSDLSILAGTNNPYGLTLTMSVPDTNLTNSSTTITNDETHNPNNIPLDSSNHPIIPTLSSGTTYTESSFTTNTWGYKLSTDTNYSAVPSSLELLNTDSAHNAITTTLNLAAKVDGTRLAGVYSTTLNFAMVAKANTPSLVNTTWVLNTGYDSILSDATYTLSFTFNDETFENTEVSFYSYGRSFINCQDPVMGAIRAYTSEIYFINSSWSGTYTFFPRMVCAKEGWYSTSWLSQDGGYTAVNANTITITGGTDATNPDLIDWLYANATLVSS